MTGIRVPDRAGLEIEDREAQRHERAPLRGAMNELVEPVEQ